MKAVNRILGRTIKDVIGSSRKMISLPYRALVRPHQSTVPSFGLAGTRQTLILQSIWWRAQKRIGGPECMTTEERLKRPVLVQFLEEKGKTFTVFRCLIGC